MAVAVDPGHAFDIDVQVRAAAGGVGRLEMQVFFAGEEIDDFLLTRADFFPDRDGVGRVEVARGKDEVLVLGQRHLGVLGRGEGGVLRAGPFEIARGGAFKEDLGQRLAGGGDQALELGIDAGKGLGVVAGPEADGAVDGLHFLDRQGVDVLQLVLVGVFVEQVGAALGREAEHGVAAGFEDLFVAGLEQRQAHGVAGEADELAGLDPGGVVDEDFGQGGNSGVTHGRILGCAGRGGGEGGAVGIGAGSAALDHGGHGDTEAWSKAENIKLKYNIAKPVTPTPR